MKKTVNCDLCPISFDRSWDLKNHKESIHGQKKTLKPDFEFEF
jgi:hypothetical protein